MRATTAIGWLAAVLALAGCGGGEPEPEKEPMKVEDTVFGDLVGTQDKARDRTNAAIDAHREAVKAQIEAGEAPPPPEE
jgi:hypothetical protein